MDSLGSYKRRGNQWFNVPYYHVEPYALYCLRHCSKISPPQLAVMVHHASLPLGEEGMTNHVLIYSPLDERHYAVGYERSRFEVSIFLPPEHHLRCTFPITEAAREEAIKAVYRRPDVMSYVTQCMRRVNSRGLSLHLLATPGMSVNRAIKLGIA